MPSTETEEIESESLVRLRLITHNARLVDARKERGMTAEAMARAAGLSRDRLRRIETLKILPTVDDIVRIACVLEKTTDYLFPEELISAIEGGVFSRRKAELAAPEVISLTQAQLLRLSYDGEAAMIEALDRKLLPERIQEVLGTLAPRGRRVITLRFGLDGKRPKTYEEVSRELAMTRERIRQIESKALRQLRHPSRSRKLLDFV